jgi:hypothetical protein
MTTRAQNATLLVVDAMPRTIDEAALVLADMHLARMVIEDGRIVLTACREPDVYEVIVLDATLEPYVWPVPFWGDPDPSEVRWFRRVREYQRYPTRRKALAAHRRRVQLWEAQRTVVS